MDRISALPQETIEKILSLMPIRDALRTSILSRQWRYSWTGMPKLAFDACKVVSSRNQDTDKYKLVSAIFHVLLLHKAPILELSLFVDTDFMSSEIDQIILHLSRSNNRKKLILKNWGGDIYLLPCSFFSLEGLEHLHLSDCTFKLPLMNKGFSMLKSLHFNGCYRITNKKLLGFLNICPVLEEFTWIQDSIMIKLTEYELVKLFKCLPLVQVLEISMLHIKNLGAGGMPHKLPISLVHLRRLVLTVCFCELSYVLCVISSSPKLEKIKLKMCWDHERFCARQPMGNYLLDLQDYSDLNLDHLKELEITSFHNYALEMEFVELIMAKSPVLEKARIELNSTVSVDEEVEMLRGLVLLPLPRASPTANLIIKRPKITDMKANRVLMMLD